MNAKDTSIANTNSTETKNKMPLTVGILIFEHVEVLDVAGPFEVFSVARLNEEHMSQELPLFKVMLIAEKKDPVNAVGGLKLIPDVTFDNCPKLDLLIVPGGMGTRKEVYNSTLVEWIQKQSSHVSLTASICTGSSLLGKAGLLDGWDATTHWKAFDFLYACAPKAYIKRGVRFTLTEPIFTSAGVAAGIDLALRIVSHFFGDKIGQATAKHMEYPYPKTDRLRKD